MRCSWLNAAVMYFAAAMQQGGLLGYLELRLKGYWIVFQQDLCSVALP